MTGIIAGCDPQAPRSLHLRAEAGPPGLGGRLRVRGVRRQGRCPRHRPVRFAPAARPVSSGVGAAGRALGRRDVLADRGRGGATRRVAPAPCAVLQRRAARAQPRPRRSAGRPQEGPDDDGRRRREAPAAAPCGRGRGPRARGGDPGLQPLGEELAGRGARGAGGEVPVRRVRGDRSSRPRAAGAPGVEPARRLGGAQDPARAGRARRRLGRRARSAGDGAAHEVPAGCHASPTPSHAGAGYNRGVRAHPHRRLLAPARAVVARAAASQGADPQGGPGRGAGCGSRTDGGTPWA